MNQEKAVLIRLLESYPVDLLKFSYNKQDLNQTHLLKEIVEENSKEQIIKYAFDHFGMLHQHVYVVELNNEIPTNWKPPLTYFISKKVDSTGNRIFDLLFEMQYSYYDTRAKDQDYLLFYWPVQFKVYKNFLVIKFNTKENSLKRYFNHPIFPLAKNLNEEGILEIIKDLLPNGTTFVPTDLNKGIKKLWADDLVDAQYSQFKDSKSTSIEAMDEDNLIKATYPDKYAKMILAPIDKSIFHVRQNNGHIFIPKFKIEPKKGKFAVTRYSDNVESVNALVQEVIDNN